MRERTLSIYCPFRHRSFALDHCRACPRLVTWPEEAESGAHLVCAADDREPEARAIAVHVPEQRLSGRVETAAAATPIGVVMRAHCVAVHADLALDDLRKELGEQTGRALPVVNEEGRLIGVVAADNATPRPPSVRPSVEAILSRLAPTTVNEVMTAHVVAFPESGRVREALNAMLVERVRYLPVVAEDGAVVGMVWDLDLLSWLARARDTEG